MQKIIILFSLVYISFQSSIIGLKATDRFFPIIMNWIKNQEQKLDQQMAFNAIQSMLLILQEELNNEQENNEFLELYHQQIQNLSNLNVQFEDQLSIQLVNFLNDELKNEVKFFQNMIKDKEKMLEQDIKELEKLKRHSRDRTKTEQKLQEINILLKEIDKNLEIGTAEKLYGLLEIIESKAVIGLFQYQKEYEEIQQYLKHVDLMFKSRNFQQDKFEIVNLISLVRNVLLDLKLNIINKTQEEQLEELEAISFFETSKTTHSLAKDYFMNELQSFLQTLINLWETFSKNQINTKQDIVETNNLITQFYQQNTKINQNINHDLELNNYQIKRLQQNFLEQIKRY